MKRLFWFLILVGAVLLSAGPVLAAAPATSSLSVSGPIKSLPFTISGPGYYYLNGNLTYSGTTDAITVLSDNVTIDLMGYTMIGPGNSSGVHGINVGGSSSYPSNVEVRNGTITNFGWGILGPVSTNSRAIGIRSINNGGGMWLGTNSYIEGCNCSNNVLRGMEVQSGTVSGCIACNNTGEGIQLVDTGVVIGNVANNNSGPGFWLSVVYNNFIMVDHNSASGNGNGVNYNYGTNIAWGVNGGH